MVSLCIDGSSYGWTIRPKPERWPLSQLPCRQLHIHYRDYLQCSDNLDWYWRRPIRDQTCFPPFAILMCIEFSDPYTLLPAKASSIYVIESVSVNNSLCHCYRRVNTPIFCIELIFAYFPRCNMQHTHAVCNVLQWGKQMLNIPMVHFSFFHCIRELISFFGGVCVIWNTVCGSGCSQEVLGSFIFYIYLFIDGAAP